MEQNQRNPSHLKHSEVMPTTPNHGFREGGLNLQSWSAIQLNLHETGIQEKRVICCMPSRNFVGYSEFRDSEYVLQDLRFVKDDCLFFLFSIEDFVGMHQ